MDGIAMDADSISKINEDTVKAKWMGDTEFVEFAFFFARTVSNRCVSSKQGFGN